MVQISIRLDEELVDELNREQKEYGFSNRSEYIRYLIKNNPLRTQFTQDSSEDLLTASKLFEEVEQLQSEIEELKTEIDHQNTRSSELQFNNEPKEPDRQATFADNSIDQIVATIQDESSTVARLNECRSALQWLKERERPASKADFIENLYSDDSNFSKNTWWEYVRDALNIAQNEGVVEYRESQRDYQWTH